MQFSDSLDHGPWPHDMRLTIEEPSTLYLLLFVRSAWGLDFNGVPPLESEPDPGSTRAPAGLDRVEANARWADDWERAFEVVAPPKVQTGGADAAMQLFLAGDLDDTELINAVSTEAFWRVGLDADAEWAWRRSLRREPLEGSAGPEYEAVEWLVPVWRTGLRTIIELPYAGYYAERIDSERVVVSTATRHDPQLYSLALSTF